MIRSRTWKAVAAVAAALCIGLWLRVPLRVEAAPSPPLGVAPLPLDDNLPVELTSLQMDAYVKDSRGRTSVTVQCEYRVRSSDAARSVDVQVGFPLRLNDAPGFDLAQYQGFSLTLDGQAVQPDPPVATRPYYVVRARLAPKQAARLNLEYSMDVGEAPIIELRYVWQPAVAWSGSVGGARVSVHLSQPTTPELLLSYDPELATFDGKTMTWDDADFEPEGTVSVSLIAPGVWHDVSTARQAIAEGGDTAQEHHRLASLYQQLDSYGPSALPKERSFRAEILSHLLKAQDLDPAFVRAHLDLAAFYLARAEEDQRSGHHYLSLAARALSDALALQPADNTARAQLVETYQRLAVAARQQGDYRVALASFGEVLESSAPGDRAQLEDSIQQEIDTTYLTWTAALLSRGQIDEALEIVAEHMGEDPVPTYSKYRPATLSLHAQISTRATSRQGRFRLTPYGDSAPLTELLSGLADSLQAVHGCAASVAQEDDAVVLVVETSFEDAEQLEETLQQMAEVFPAGVEDSTLLLIESALIPSSVWVAEAEIPAVMDGGYREAVDLTAPATALDAIRERTNWAIMDLGEQDPADEREKALRDVSLGLLKKYARTWQRQGDETRVDYEVAFVSSFAEPQARGWSLGLGRVESLRWSVRLYDKPVIVRVLVGAAIVLGILLWLMGLARRRRRRA